MKPMTVGRLLDVRHEDLLDEAVGRLVGCHCPPPVTAPPTCTRPRPPAVKRRPLDRGFDLSLSVSAASGRG